MRREVRDISCLLHEVNALWIKKKITCSTIYNHIITIQNYIWYIFSLPLKSPITLLKPTLAIISFPEEDYGLHKSNLNRDSYINKILIYKATW